MGEATAEPAFQEKKVPAYLIPLKYWNMECRETFHSKRDGLTDSSSPPRSPICRLELDVGVTFHSCWNAVYR